LKINKLRGVSLSDKNDSKNQNYNTPEKVILERKSDIIIVGRGIYLKEDIFEEAKKYKIEAWDSYQKRINK
jgi:uridine monophosphate synthetase